jgi:hypothetical protein
MALLLTPFFWKKKTGKKDKEEQPMKRQYNPPIKEKEGWSAGLADGQRSLTLSIDGLVGQTDRPMVN